MPLLKLYFEKLLYSPLEFPKFMKQIEKDNVRIVTQIAKAHIIMSSYLSILKKHANRFGSKKKYLLWTHEPYHDFTFIPKIKTNNNAKIYIMNVYTGDVFTHNFRYFYFNELLTIYQLSKTEDSHTPIFELNKQLNIEFSHPDFKKLLIKDKLMSKVKSTPRPVVALSTYYSKKYYQGNLHTSLPKRYELIEYGYLNGYLDLYGKGWDKHPTVKIVENSRNNGDRRQTKNEILPRYLFNLCLENVDYPYYVTEKIWEPIKNGCLPIYYSNTTIYQVFPENSFVDYRDFDNPEQLYKYLDNMTKHEYFERLNRCIEAFNHVIDQGNNTTFDGHSTNSNINYLEYETCYKSLSEKIKYIGASILKGK